NWVSQGLLREMNARGLSPDDAGDFPLTPEALGELVKLQDEGTISKQAADEVLTAMIEEKRSAREIVDARGLAQVSDAAELASAVAKAIAENPDPVADYQAGKKQALGRIMGAVMKATGGKANPQVVKSLLEKKLAE
ncbi:MAG: Asp-tRNA(Asn)/Glu-tRNA(Gln) amidotransferase GatCAB subunit B, partial [Planctomycetia bacterium]|nr:Asp-tRNA(Asn)/Glu-tRNA(Gln) amidotransferase GatCAB subunit B [Planctomycetia bacterium]